MNGKSNKENYTKGVENINGKWKNLYDSVY